MLGRASKKTYHLKNSSNGEVEASDGHLKFTGQLSNKFNGGFSSCRTKFEAGTLKDFSGIEIEVKGSARTFQARFNPAYSSEIGVRYSRVSFHISSE